METIKLFNKGQRTIQFDGGELRAGKTGSFPKELGEYLNKLYAGELQNLEEAVQIFNQPAEITVESQSGEPAQTSELNDKSLEELQTILDERGVKYHHKAGKDKLIELINA